MAINPLGRLDDRIGDGLERLVAAHHRRRLRRHGHGGSIDPPAGGWADGGAFAPRVQTSVEVLVDGAEALPRIAAEVAAARSHVHVAGWTFTPGFRVGDGGPALKELLAGAAQHADVRVLAWAGAPLPLFHPDRGEVRAMRDELVGGTAIRMGLDARERPLHCHHEKIVLVDDRVAFVGGIDLTSLAGDRLDDGAHPVRGEIGWHDVCLRLEGEIVADVAAHLALRWREVTGERLAAGGVAAGGGDVAAQLVRTVPESIYDGLPAGEFTILESYLRALRAAERIVYLESQFLWSPEVVSVLAEKLRNPPSDAFRVVVLLPARPNNGADDTRGQLGVLAEADVDDRFLACTLYQAGPGGRPVYVHAKVGIVDDRWLTVGSANLNEHSLFNDTEVNVVVQDEALARRTRLRLWSEHLELPVDEVSGDPAHVVDELWRPRAAATLRERRERGHADRRLTLLPGVSRRSRALLGPLNGLLVDG